MGMLTASVMSNAAKWRIIRGAARVDACEDALREIKRTEPQRYHDGYLEYPSPESCAKIANHIHKNHSQVVAEIKPGVSLASINVCQFNHTDKPASRIVGTSGEVYVVIALTTLDERSGMFAFAATEDDKLKEETPVLEVGDAVVWTEQNSGCRSPGGGGYMQVMIYR